MIKPSKLDIVVNGLPEGHKAKDELKELRAQLANYQRVHEFMEERSEFVRKALSENENDARIVTTLILWITFIGAAGIGASKFMELIG